MLLLCLAPPAVVVGIVRSLRARGDVSVEAVFGVLCLYILLGMFFAGIYGSIDRVDHHFFANGRRPRVAHCLYFSFITLTTVGYGDSPPPATSVTRCPCRRGADRVRSTWSRSSR